MAKEIVRVYEIVEGFNPMYDEEVIDLENDYHGLILKEYLQVDKNKVETGRTFSTNILLRKLEEEQDKGQLQGSVSYNEQDGSFLYQFHHFKSANLHPEYEAVTTEELSFIISKQILEKYLNDNRIQRLEETMNRIINNANTVTVDAQESKIRKDRRYKTQKINSFRKAAGVIAAIAGTAVIISSVPKIVDIVKEKQDSQWQKEQEMLKEQGPTILELQELDDYNELDQWDLYLQQQREENERLRKLP